MTAGRRGGMFGLVKRIKKANRRAHACDTRSRAGGYRASWGRTAAPLFEQGRQPLIPVREFDTDRALRMVLR